MVKLNYTNNHLIKLPQIQKTLNFRTIIFYSFEKHPKGTNPYRTISVTCSIYD